MSARPAFCSLHRPLLLALILILSTVSAEAAWKIARKTGGGREEILSVTKVDEAVREEGRVVRELPFALAEGQPPTGERFVEEIVSDAQFARLKKARGGNRYEARIHTNLEWPGSEVRTLVEQGPTGNRINLTIVGDGYTAEEKEKFFGDARRMTNDLFEGDTFKSYLPLFNVYAVFVPSRESGLTDRVRKDTALGLYRDPVGSKRAIMPGDTRAAERAIALAPATDYPILMANDDFYGGLGGRYAITTRSETSGTVVLRHELGHNFGNVGEEYDGGYVYQGANFSRNRGSEWAHWAEGSMKVNDSELLFHAYPWHELSEGPFRQGFSVPNGDWTFGVILSSVGWETPGDVRVRLGEQTIEIDGKYHADRSFFLPRAPVMLRPGDHELEIAEQIRDGDNVVATVQGNAFPRDYDFRPNVIGAYATFDSWGSKVGHRPTHQSCLMREMQVTHFCAPDQENMWIRFLRKVKLIDDVTVTRSGQAARIEAKTPPLEGLTLKWYSLDSRGRETELTEQAGKRVWDAPTGLQGRIRLRVQFETPEVRLRARELTSEKDVTI